MSSVFYIDGFNLYNTRLKSFPEYRWLNLENLARRLDENSSTPVVNFYTARMKSDLRPEQPERQAKYIRALERFTDVRLHVSHFQYTDRFATLSKCGSTRPKDFAWPKPKPTLVKVRVSQEKDSDVALASHLVRDAATRRFDTYYILSGDSDFAEPIKIAREEFGAKVILVIPGRPTKDGNRWLAKKLTQAANKYIFLDNEDFAQSQFPDLLESAKGKPIRRPETWCKRG